MKVVKTKLSNNNIGPPPGKEGEIGDLPCQIEDDAWGKGTRVIWSVWELNDADRQAIANGWNIRLGVGWIGYFPPVSVGVTHEKEIEDDSDD